MLRRDGQMTRGGSSVKETVPKVTVSIIAGMRMVRNAQNFALAHMIQDFVNTCYVLKPFASDPDKFHESIISAMQSLGYPTKDLGFNIFPVQNLSSITFNISDQRTKSGIIATFVVNLLEDNHVTKVSEKGNTRVDVFSVKFV